MKKLLFVTLPLRKDLKKCIYPVNGNSFLEIKEPIYFAATCALANLLKADDEVKVILLKTEGGDNAGDENAKLFQEELNHFNNVGAKISYKVIPSTFDPSRTNFQFLFKALLKELEHDTKIYAEVTYGPKPLTFLLFTVFQFAEKFFDNFIGSIVYSKVEFKNNEIVEGSQKIYDITPLYLMNSFTNLIQASSSDHAIKAIETLFKG